MCNAWNHADDCECGFGPPYGFLGVANIVGYTNWIDLAVWNEAEFRRGINEVIADRRIIKKIQENYKRQGFPLANMYERRWEKLNMDRKKEIYFKLKELLLMVRIEAGVPETRIVRIPLFKLTSPPVQDSEVTYHESPAGEVAWNVTIAFPGVGMATWKTIGISYSCDVSCGNGGCKTISVPIYVKKTPLKVFSSDGKLINKCVQVEAANKNDNNQFTRAVDSGQDKECEDKVSSLIDVFDLLRDRSKYPSLRTIKLQTSRSRDFFIGIDTLNLKANLKAIVKFENVLEIKSKLPPGHRYHTYRISDRHGIAWRIRSRHRYGGP